MEHDHDYRMSQEKHRFLSLESQRHGRNRLRGDVPETQHQSWSAPKTTKVESFKSQAIQGAQRRSRQANPEWVYLGSKVPQVGFNKYKAALDRGAVVIEQPK